MLEKMKEMIAEQLSVEADSVTEASSCGWGICGS